MILLLTFILLVAIYLFISEKIPLDLTGIGILATLMLTGILTPVEALRGFSNTAVVTIGSMLVLSRGLVRSGAISFVSDFLIKYSKGNEKRILIISIIATAIPSAFIINTLVVVLFITIIMSICCEYGLSPSKYLLPISYASIVGGMCTLIGTSTNIIVSDLSARYGYGTIGMFELAWVGLPLAIITIGLLYLFAPRLMPNHKAPVCELRGERAPHYLAELKVKAGSRLIGRNPIEFFSTRFPEVELFEVIRGPWIFYPEREQIVLEAGDLLLVKATASDLVIILGKDLVELPYSSRKTAFKERDDKMLIVELIIPPQSRFMGEQPILSGMNEELGIQIIAVKRRGIHYSQQKIGNLRLAVGDVLLVHCTREKLDELRPKPDLVILEDVYHQIMNRKKAPLAIIIFVSMVAATSTELASLEMSAVTAVFAMVVTGCIQLRHAYRSIDARILILIVGALALGTAMEKTGAAVVYAELFLTPLQGQSPELILSALILLTIILTELMSNSATAVLLLPIAVSTAAAIGVNPKPFIIGICFGATCAFAIPIGYQTHLLVFGPGGYRSSDFLKLGLPIDLITWLVTSLLIPVFWPFHP